jgi:CheY-like chemotaxis protein
MPIFVLTASALIENSEAILSIGFDAFIAKPIDERIFLKQ